MQQDRTPLDVVGGARDSRRYLVQLPPQFGGPAEVLAAHRIKRGAAQDGRFAGLERQQQLDQLLGGFGFPVIGIQLAPAKYTVIKEKEFVEKLPAKPGITAPIVQGQIVNLKGGRFLRLSV